MNTRPRAHELPKRGEVRTAPLFWRPWRRWRPGVSLLPGRRIISSQARAMGRLRRAALAETDPVAKAAAQHSVAAGARRALVLRTGIALLSAALFAVAVCTAA